MAEAETDADLRWVAVGRSADWVEDIPRPVAIGVRRILVLRHQDRWYACKDSCPHAGLPLANGAVHAGTLICRHHAWTFDLASGRGPGDSCLRSYPVRLSGEQVEIGV